MDHQLHTCPPDCDKEFCNYCRGGLSLCDVCKGAEATLPTDCPGRVLTDGEKHAILLGEIDFINGAWAPGHRMDLG